MPTMNDRKHAEELGTTSKEPRMPSSLVRMLREKFEYDKIDNFPAYMLDYVVNGERGDLEEREIDAFEDWMDQNGYVSINPVSDEEWSEDFCSHPAFGLACDCVPVYAERGETSDRYGKSRMIKENASYRGATVAKVKRDLSRKLKRAGFKYIREVMGLGGSGDQIEKWSKNGEVVDVILRGQSGDPSHIEAILLHTGDKDREYIDAYGNAEAAVDSAVEWLVNKMEKKNESRQRRGRMLKEARKKEKKRPVESDFDVTEEQMLELEDALGDERMYGGGIEDAAVKINAKKSGRNVIFAEISIYVLCDGDFGEDEDGNFITDPRWIKFDIDNAYKFYYGLNPDKYDTEEEWYCAGTTHYTDDDVMAIFEEDVTDYVQSKF